MDKQFWHNKWHANEIGFHLPDVHPLLKKFAGTIFASKPNVFVPLCGKSQDLIFLQSLGGDIVGSELSDIAIKAFYQESFSQPELEIKKDESRGFFRYQYSHITILAGDFFKLNKNDIQPSNYVYDRAALVALPHELRIKYVKQLRAILTKASMLLISLDYQQSVASGPPFSVDEKEVNQLFSFAEVNQLYRKDIIEKEPRFRSKGLTEFFESAYHIRW